MSEVTVLGIFVADLSFSANKIPTTGETILGDKYNIGPGGKGCNQAIALARLGCNVNFICKIGDDDYGKLALDSLKQNKIDTSNIIISKEHQTGVAGIHVDSNTGQNAITVVRGAPSSLTTKEIDINLIKQSKDVKDQDISILIDRLNKDKNVDGIILQLPIPSHLNDRKLIETISPLKDVDGLTSTNIGLLSTGNPRFIPATAYGIMEILRKEKIVTQGKRIVVIGRSDIVGKPMVALLSGKDENATVTLCHSKTVNCLLYTSPSPRDVEESRMPSSA